MSWTYTSPGASSKDKVRFLVGDTDTTEQLVTDEEINDTLADHPNPNRCAAEICLNIAAKFARKADTTNAGLSVSGSQRAIAYERLAAKLRRKAALSGGTSVWSGNRSVSEAETANEDESVNQPAFKVGQNDFETQTSEEQ